MFVPDAPTALDEVSHRLYDQYVKITDALEAHGDFPTPLPAGSLNDVSRWLERALNAERFDPEPHNEMLAKLGICRCGKCEANA